MKKHCGFIVFFVFFFCLVFRAGPAHAAWQYSRTITVGVNASGTQANFPMLVSIASSSYLQTTSTGGRVTNGNGYDIVFSSSSDCAGPMSFETESYTSSTGALVDWVNVPSIASGTVIYLCYGNSAISTDQSNQHATWNSSFQMVQHMANGSFNDSSVKGINFTPVNVTATSTGKIGGSVYFNGTSSYASSTVPITFATSGAMSAWVYQSSTQFVGAKMILVPRNQNNITFLGTSNSQPRAFMEDTSATQHGATASTAMSDYAWHYIVGTWANPANLSSSISLYVDGVFATTTNFAANISKNSSTRALFGVNASGTQQVGIQYWPGFIDETRLTTNTRASDWILTEYNNQNAPASFYNLGNETPVVLPAPIISNVVATTGSTSTIITWDTNVGADSEVNYGTSTPYTASSTYGATYVASHTVALANLIGLTLYHFQVVSSDGSVATSTDATFTTPFYDATPPLVMWVSPTNNITASGTVMLSASSTDETAVASVAFYAGNYGASLAGSTLIGSTTTASGTIYSISWNTVAFANGSTTLWVLSADTANNTSSASTTVNVNNSPLISGIATSTATSSATIVWTTNHAATSQVSYGATAGYGSSTATSTLTTGHTIQLIGLASGQTYHYQILSTDAQGNTATTSDATFAILPPAISSFSALPAIVAFAGTSTLSWNIANASSVAITPGSFSTSTLTASTTVNPTSTTVYTLTATNTNGTSTATATVTVDNAAPSAPASFTAVATGTLIHLSWASSTDTGGSGLLGYNIFRCLGSCTPSVKIATSSGVSYLDNGLATSTAYTYAVSAYDAVLNTSATSTTASATTDQAPNLTIVTFRVGVNGYAGGEDNTIALDHATTTYSLGGPTYADRFDIEASGNTRKALLRFPNLGITGFISDVTLTLTENAVSGEATSSLFMFEARKITEPDWDTNSVTWKNYKTGTLWSTAGGDSGAVLATTTGVGPNLPFTLDLGNNFNVSDLGQNGILIDNATTSPTFKPVWIYSNEYATTSVRPLLTIAYTPIPDTTPPSVPTALTATSTSPSRIDLAWTASTDDTGVVGYNIYRCAGSCAPATLLATSSLSSYSDTGLTPSTAYTYAIAAYDGGNNVSSLSDASSATTMAPDVIFPTISWISPGGGQNVSGAVTLVASSTDNLGVDHVTFYANGVAVGTSTTPTPATSSLYSVSWDTTASANGAVSLQAVTLDSSNNMASSTPVTVTVNNAPVISGITVSAGTTTSTISWTTNTAATGAVNYGLTSAYGSTTSSSTLSTPHSLALTGLTGGTTYHYQVRSTDAESNTATSSDAIFMTQTPHPRIFLIPSVLQKLKAKASSSDPDWLSLKAAADADLGYTVLPFDRTSFPDGTIHYNYEGTGWLSSIEELGLAYQVTGNTAYANKVIAIMDAANAVYKNSGTLTVDATNNKMVTATGWTFNGNDTAIHITGGAGWTPGWYDVASISGDAAILSASPAATGTTGGIWANAEPESIDLGYPSRSAALGLAMAYDWVYDQLDATRKADTINTLNAWYDEMKYAAFNTTGPAESNYFGSHLLGFGAVGYATAADNSRAPEIQNYILNLFNTVEAPCFASGVCQGGYPIESYNYGPTHWQRILQYMTIVKDNTGTDLGFSAMGNAMATSLLYNLKPNLWQSTDEGDFSGNYTGVMPGNLPLTLASILSGTAQGGWMQSMYDNFVIPPDAAVSVQRSAVFDRFLYADSARPAISYQATQPLSYYSSGDDHVYARSDWSTSSVWSSFTGGTVNWGSGHQTHGAGSIYVQRGNDYLLVNDGQWKGTDGVSGAVKVFDSTNSWRVNSLFFNDFGTYTYCSNPPACDTGNYVGGQGVWAAANDVLASSTGANYAYAKSDLSGAYIMGAKPDPTLPTFVRSYAFLGDRYIVVYDRAIATDSSYVKKLFWHFNPNGIPTLSANTLQSTVGSSTLFVKTLLPASPLITIVADDKNGINGTTTPTTYRAEVSDSAISTGLNVLTVMDADAAGSAMPTTIAITSTGGAMVGTLILDPEAPRIVMFSADGSAQTSTRYVVTYSSPGAGRHLIFDLQPGSYDVYHDSTKIVTAASVASNGVLSFTSAGNSLFQVVPNGLTVTSTPSVVSFSASPSVIASAGTSALSWNIDNASSVAITPGSFSTTTLAGSITVNPTSTIMYVLTATNENGTTTGQATVTVDSIPPTVPVNLAATAVSISEIDLTWASSTDDNGGVSGYAVFRNGIQIATTTSLSYQDTGLSAGTTYTYAVSSYDGFGNTSAQSANLAAITQSLPSNGGTTAVGGGGGGSGSGYYYYPPAPTPASSSSSVSGPGQTGNASQLLSLIAQLRSFALKLFLQTNNGRPLTIGSRGTDVWALQIFLEFGGTGPASAKLAAIGPTGYFGAATQNALAEYQKSVGITPAVGYFGPKTRAVMMGTGN